MSKVVPAIKENYKFSTFTINWQHACIIAITLKEKGKLCVPCHRKSLNKEQKNLVEQACQVKFFSDPVYR